MLGPRADTRQLCISQLKSSLPPSYPKRQQLIRLDCIDTYSVSNRRPNKFLRGKTLRRRWNALDSLIAQKSTRVTPKKQAVDVVQRSTESGAIAFFDVSPGRPPYSSSSSKRPPSFKRTPGLVRSSPLPRIQTAPRPPLRCMAFFGVTFTCVAVLRSLCRQPQPLLVYRFCVVQDEVSSLAVFVQVPMSRRWCSRVDRAAVEGTGPGPRHFKRQRLQQQQQQQQQQQ